MIFNKVLASFLVIGIASAASPSLAKSFVTQKEIAATSKGYLVKAPNGTKFRIKSAIPSGDKKYKCKVHIPSVINEVMSLQARGGGKKGQSATIEIQKKYTLQGDPYCIGKGAGCKLTLTVEN